MKRVRALTPILALVAAVWLLLAAWHAGVSLQIVSIILAVLAVGVVIDTGMRPYQLRYRALSFLGGVMVALSALTVFTLPAGASLFALMVGVVGGTALVWLGGFLDKQSYSRA